MHNVAQEVYAQLGLVLCCLLSLSTDIFYQNFIFNSLALREVITRTISLSQVNTLRPRQNGRHFADDIFKYIFLNENVWIPIRISLKFVPKGPINNIPALVQIMAWRRPGDKPLSEPVMFGLLTHICVTRPEWVNQTWIVTINESHASTKNF